MTALLAPSQSSCIGLMYCRVHSGFYSGRPALRPCGASLSCSKSLTNNIRVIRLSGIPSGCPISLPAKLSRQEWHRDVPFTEPRMQFCRELTPGPGCAHDVLYQPVSIPLISGGRYPWDPSAADWLFSTGRLPGGEKNSLACRCGRQCRPSGVLSE